MDEEVRIDIIVPVYNVAPYLNSFFESLLNQTFQGFKVFVVYDESSDGSLTILRDYEKKYQEKITVMISPQKNGVGAARDYVLESGLLKHEFIMFLDPDDYLEKEFLYKLISASDQSKADLVVCGFDRIDEETGKVLSRDMVHNAPEYQKDLWQKDTMAFVNPAVWNKLYRKEILKDVRFSKIKRAEDLFFHAQTILKVQSVYFINEILYHYRVRDDSLSNTIKKSEYDETIKCFKQMQIDKEYVNVLTLLLFIRIAVGMTYRASIGDRKNIEYFVQRTESFFIELLPNWKKCEFLKLRNLKKHGIKGIALWGCKKLYQIKSFSIYIHIYYFITKKFKKDIKI